MVTWYDVKLATLKKIDPAITSLTPTRNTKDYLNAMVPVANRGLQDLATAGKFIIKDLAIMVSDVESVIEVDASITQHYNQDIEIKGPAAKSYSFEVSGKAEIHIYIGETLSQTRKTSAETGFRVVKGLLDDPEEKPVKIVFSGSFPYQFRNVALYDVCFETEDDVWEYSEKRRYDLRKLTSDFFKLVTYDVVKESDHILYEKYHDYEWEGESTLVLNGIKQAVYKVHYYAYPQEITDDTPDNTVMALDPEVANILPVYMASELYEDDDTSTAFYFRQQYEEAKQKLKPTMKQGKAVFEDVWGWC